MRLLIYVLNFETSLKHEKVRVQLGLGLMFIFLFASQLNLCPKINVPGAGPGALSYAFFELPKPGEGGLGAPRSWGRGAPARGRWTGRGCWCGGERGGVLD